MVPFLQDVRVDFVIFEKVICGGIISHGRGGELASLLYMLADNAFEVADFVFSLDGAAEGAQGGDTTAGSNAGGLTGWLMLVASATFDWVFVWDSLALSSQ